MGKRTRVCVLDTNHQNGNKMKKQGMHWLSMNQPPVPGPVLPEWFPLVFAWGPHTPSCWWSCSWYSASSAMHAEWPLQVKASLSIIVLLLVTANKSMKKKRKKIHTLEYLYKEPLIKTNLMRDHLFFKTAFSEISLHNSEYTNRSARTATSYSVTISDSITAYYYQ